MSNKNELTFSDKWNIVHALGVEQGTLDGVGANLFCLYGSETCYMSGSTEDTADKVIASALDDSPMRDGGLSDANVLRSAYGTGYQRGVERTIGQ